MFRSLYLGIAAVIGVAGLVSVLSGCTRPGRQPASVTLERFAFTQPQMGVPFRIVLYAPDVATASNAAHAAFARIAALNRIMSDYDEDTELTQLSRSAGSGQAVKVSDDLWRVLEIAQVFSRRTDGAFDITVGPLVQLWRRARRQRELPDPTRLNAALRAVGYEHLLLDPRHRTATLRVPGMRLDLGSIAKGYAADEALNVLRSLGITRALVTGGGDMAAGDSPPGTRGWRIEVSPLDATNAPPPRFVLLKKAGLATSGDLFQHVEIGGQRYSHIVDPRTGIGLTDHSLVTVIARDCLTANGLSTSLSVLGPETGLALVGSTRGAAALFTRKPGDQIEVVESRRFRTFLDAPPQAVR